MFRLISPIISIILAFVVFFFLAKPMFADIKANQDETNQYKEAVDKAAQFNNQLQSLITQRNSFSASQLKRLETLVPYDIDEVRALVDLKALAEQNGLFFGNIGVKEPKQSNSSKNAQAGTSGASMSAADFDSIDISFGVIGTYEQMRAFLSDIEHNLVMMDIMNLSFSTTESNLSLYNFTVRLHAIKSNPTG
jgi:Tfp pilus assembly protein PilO